MHSIRLPHHDMYMIAKAIVISISCKGHRYTFENEKQFLTDEN